MSLEHKKDLMSNVIDSFISDISLFMRAHIHTLRVVALSPCSMAQRAHTILLRLSPCMLPHESDESRWAALRAIGYAGAGREGQPESMEAFELSEEDMARLSKATKPAGEAGDCDVTLAV